MASPKNGTRVSNNQVKVHAAAKVRVASEKIRDWNDLINLTVVSIEDVYHERVTPAVNNSAMNSLGKLLHMVDIYQRQKGLGIRVKPPKLLT